MYPSIPVIHTRTHSLTHKHTHTLTPTHQHHCHSQNITQIHIAVYNKHLKSVDAPFSGARGADMTQNQPDQTLFTSQCKKNPNDDQKKLLLTLNGCLRTKEYGLYQDNTSSMK